MLYLFSNSQIENQLAVLKAHRRLTIWGNRIILLIHKTSGKLMRNFWAILAVALLIFSASASASESKESGQSPYAKLESFTVNLQGLTHYLQVSIALKVAKTEVGEAIKGWNPVIRHELILLLSNQSSEELATIEGKRKVMAAIKAAINKILKLDDKEGVSDVLFESFVIQ
jgi:flagellar FliL protein